MATFPMLPDVGRMTAPARPDAAAARGLFLDDRYLKAAVAWAKDFRAGGERL